MKIRSSHITNSSSSSFILETQTSTKKIALDIVQGLHSDLESMDERTYRANSTLRLRSVQSYFRERQDFDLPILISWTCNYETWIYRTRSDEVAISTCNNDPIESYLDDGEIISRGDGSDAGIMPPYDLPFLNLDTMNWTTRRIFDSRWEDAHQDIQAPPAVPVPLNGQNEITAKKPEQKEEIRPSFDLIGKI